ncbi:hypothetical protein [Falsiruegeria mediterranea]
MDLTDEVMQRIRVSKMIPHARRCISREAGQPTDHVVSDDGRLHEIYCAGVEIVVDPASKSSKQILEQWMYKRDAEAPTTQADPV